MQYNGLNTLGRTKTTWNTVGHNIQPTEKHKEIWSEKRKIGKEKIQQMHDRICFKPIRKQELNKQELKQTLESLIFHTEKKSGETKAQHSIDRSP